MQRQVQRKQNIIRGTKRKIHQRSFGYDQNDCFRKAVSKLCAVRIKLESIFSMRNHLLAFRTSEKTELTFDLFCVIFQRVIFLVSQFNLTQLSPAEIKIEPCESTEAAGSIPWRVESYQKKTNQQRTELIQIITHFAYNGVFN